MESVELPVDWIVDIEGQIKSYTQIFKIYFWLCWVFAAGALHSGKHAPLLAAGVILILEVSILVGTGSRHAASVAAAAGSRAQDSCGARA